MKGMRLFSLVAASALFVGLIISTNDCEKEAISKGETKIAVVGNPDVLQARYEEWRSQIASDGGQPYVLGLSWIRGLSKQETDATGHVIMDFTREVVSAEVFADLRRAAGAPEWLVEAALSSFDSCAAGYGGEVTDNAARLAGHPPMGLADALGKLLAAEAS